MPHKGLGDVLYVTGRFREAIPHYQEAIQVAPSYGAPYTGLANAYAALGETDKAEAARAAALQREQRRPRRVRE
jgi:Flp pilus assembly protein TadD